MMLVPRAVREVAYRAVRTAREKGLIVKPSKCERCGRGDEARGRRSMLHAHHHDYAKPLDVEWICAWCHRQETPIGRNRLVRPEVQGPQNGNAKLTWEQARVISQSQESNRALGRRYGVSYTVIRNIKNGTSYAAIRAQKADARDKGGEGADPA